MHVMQEQINVCNATMIFEVHKWSFKSFSLIKLWVQNWVFTSTYADPYPEILINIETEQKPKA